MTCKSNGLFRKSKIMFNNDPAQLPQARIPIVLVIHIYASLEKDEHTKREALHCCHISYLF